ncbi:reverse transcriptase domain-containing protein [Paraburkholderia sp. UCT70]|uniref:reverse transcriptase domain-containing protein n=1 Tax=Paraburkholderia sp. UCT70 TaxID=2991068 RepID=UPI003D2097F5
MPQGSPISPLLANVYMRRFVLAWKKLGLERSPGSRIVTYADDLVILCAYSTPNRTPIPRRTEHGFHSKPSVDSTANRAGIPRLPERDFHA